MRPLLFIITLEEPRGCGGMTRVRGETDKKEDIIKK